MVREYTFIHILRQEQADVLCDEFWSGQRLDEHPDHLIRPQYASIHDLVEVLAVKLCFEHDAGRGVGECHVEGGRLGIGRVINGNVVAIRHFVQLDADEGARDLNVLSGRCLGLALDLLLHLVEFFFAETDAAFLCRQEPVVCVHLDAIPRHSG